MRRLQSATVLGINNVCPVELALPCAAMATCLVEYQLTQIPLDDLRGCRYVNGEFRCLQAAAVYDNWLWTRDLWNPEL